VKERNHTCDERGVLDLKMDPTGNGNIKLTTGRGSVQERKEREDRGIFTNFLFMEKWNRCVKSSEMMSMSAVLQRKAKTFMFVVLTASRSNRFTESLDDRLWASLSSSMLIVSLENCLKAALGVLMFLNLSQDL
jgi:hypothetical protein